MTVPVLFASIRLASRKMAKWAERGDLAMGKCSASSPAFIGFLRSNCRICRRVGSESALKTRFIFRYLAKYGKKVKSAMLAARLEAGMDDLARGWTILWAHGHGRMAAVAAIMIAVLAAVA